MNVNLSNINSKIVLVDKPKGISSFDVVRIMQKKLQTRKIGHAGTLDPLASGLMLLGVGKGTKQLTSLLGLPKVYEVSMLLGRQTTTGDLEGTILAESEVKSFDIAQLSEILPEMVGTISLPVPKYSAIKVAGKRLYEYAREGLDVEIPIKEMELHTLIPTDVRKTELGFVVDVTMGVGSGVYIRSVAEEIGRRLDIPVTLYDLRRVTIGEYSVSDAQSIEADLNTITSRVKSFNTK